MAGYTRYQPDQKYVINQAPGQTSTYYPSPTSPYNDNRTQIGAFNAVPTPMGTRTTGTTMGPGPQQQILISNASVGMTAQMLEAATGNIIWTGAYTYEALDVESAAEGVASNLVASLPGPK